jgi:hypothetical protein
MLTVRAGVSILVAATAAGCGLLVGVEDAERRDDDATAVGSSSGAGPASGASSSSATSSGPPSACAGGGAGGGDGGGSTSMASVTASTGEGAGGDGGGTVASSGSGGEGATGQGGDGGTAGGPSSAASSTTSAGTGGGPLSGWGEPCEDADDCQAPTASCSGSVCVPTGPRASWIRRPVTSPSDQATAVWLTDHGGTGALLVTEMDGLCRLFRFALPSGWVPVADTICIDPRPKLASDGTHLVLLQGLGAPGSEAPTGAAVLVEGTTPAWLPIGQDGQLDGIASVLMIIPQSPPAFFVHGGVSNGGFAQGYQRVFGDPDVAADPWIPVDELENEPHLDGHAWAPGAPGEILIHGGVDGDTSELSRDTCTFATADFPDATWTCRTLAGPGPRYEPALASFVGRAFLHGGTGDGGNLTDTWVHDAVEDAWVEVVPSVTPADEERRPPAIGSMTSLDGHLFHAGVRDGVELWELISVGEGCSTLAPDTCASDICAARPGATNGLCCDGVCDAPATCFSDDQPGRCITP